MNNKLKNKKILLPYQEKWLINQDKVKVWEKSRRIGASYVEALNCVLKASLSKKENGMSCYYISYAKDMTQQFIKDAAFWAKLLNIACEDFGETVIKDENKAYKILNSQEKKIGSFMEKNFSIISVFRGNFSVFQRKKIPLYKQIFDVIKNNS